MHYILVGVALIASISGFVPTVAQAADGCSFDYYGRVVCAPGARPGVPYYGPGYYGAREYDVAPRYRRARCPNGWVIRDGRCRPYRQW